MRIALELRGGTRRIDDGRLLKEQRPVSPKRDERSGAMHQGRCDRLPFGLVPTKGSSKHTDGQVWGSAQYPGRVAFDMSIVNPTLNCSQLAGKRGEKQDKIGAQAAACAESFLNPNAGTRSAETTKTDKYGLLCRQRNWPALDGFSFENRLAMRGVGVRACACACQCGRSSCSLSGAEL